jgi:uncharacterized OB-fold protein
MVEQTAPYALPLPAVHPDNAPYWEALKEHELRMQRCEACDTLRFPVSPVCHNCLSDRAEWELLSGKGTLGTWIIVERATGDPAWQEVAPYIVALVNLEEGPRLTTNIVDIDPEELSYGMALEIFFDDVTPEITLAKFRRA